MSKLEEIQAKIESAIDDFIIADSHAYEEDGKITVSIQRFRFDEADAEVFESWLVEQYGLEKTGEGSGQYGPINTYKTDAA